MEEQKSNTWVWVAVVVLVLIVLGAIYYYYSYMPAPESTTGKDMATEEELANELNSLDLGNLESELGEIDKELAQ